MAATLVAARGEGPAPAWGREAVAPDWENREVSTGVRKESGFRKRAQGLTRGRIKPKWGWERGLCVLCSRQRERYSGDAGVV